MLNIGFEAPDLSKRVHGILRFGAGRLGIDGENNANEFGVSKGSGGGERVIGGVIGPVPVVVIEDGVGLILNIGDDEVDAFVGRIVSGRFTLGIDDTTIELVAVQEVADTFNLGIIIDVGIKDDFLIFG